MQNTMVYQGDDVRVILSIGQKDEAREVLGDRFAAGMGPAYESLCFFGTTVPQ